MKNIQLHSEFKYLLRERVLKNWRQNIGKSMILRTPNFHALRNVSKIKLHRKFPEVPLLYVIDKKAKRSITVNIYNFGAMLGECGFSDITKFKNASEQFEKRLQITRLVYRKMDSATFVINPQIKQEVYSEILAEVKKEFGIS
jgi:hypothetical protein